MKTKFKLLIPTIALATIGFSQEVHYIYDDAGSFGLSLGGYTFEYYSATTFKNKNPWCSDGFYELPQKTSVMTSKSLFF